VKFFELHSGTRYREFEIFVHSPGQTTRILLCGGKSTFRMPLPSYILLDSSARYQPLTRAYLFHKKNFSVFKTTSSLQNTQKNISLK